MLENGEESDAPRPRRVPQEGDYYGGFGTQTVFDTEVPKGALLIEIFRAENTVYLRKLNKDRVTLSGTKIREMLTGFRSRDC